MADANTKEMIKIAVLIAGTFMTLLAVTDTNLAIILAAIPLILTSLASLIVSLRNSFKADKIAASVDGHTTKLTEDLALANSRIERLLKISTPPDVAASVPQQL